MVSKGSGEGSGESEVDKAVGDKDGESGGEIAVGGRCFGCEGRPIEEAEDMGTTCGRGGAPLVFGRVGGTIAPGRD